jgi:hypothetical protein
MKMECSGYEILRQPNSRGQGYILSDTILGLHFQRELERCVILQRAFWKLLSWREQVQRYAFIRSFSIDWVYIHII